MVIWRFLWRVDTLGSDMEERYFPAVGTKREEGKAVKCFYLQCKREDMPVPDNNTLDRSY